MCSECHQSPCAPGCPNYEPKQVYVCEYCGEPICENEEYIELDGDAFHKDCLKSIAFDLLYERYDAQDKVARR